MPFLELGFQKLKISHFGFCVPDIRTAVDKWSGTFGAGPFFHFEAGVTFVMEDLRFKGEPFEFRRHPAAYGRFGAGMIELGQYELAKPNPELEAVFYPQANGVNHVAIYAEDPEEMSAELQERGFPRIISARVGKNLWCWHDARESLGYCLEIITDSAAVREFDRTIDRITDDWDGSDVLRTELPAAFM